MTAPDASPSLQDCLTQVCPVQFVVDILGNKWSVLLLRELLGGDRRTNELLKALPGISTKTLTLRLRELEKHQLVERRVFAEVPPHVEYALTEKGQQIRPILAAMHQVGTHWLSQPACVCPLSAATGSMLQTIPD